MSLRVEFDKRNLDKLRRMQQEIPHLTEDVRLKKSVGQLLAAQGKRNIEEQSPDGRSSYKALDSQYEKYKGFGLILVGRKKNTQTKRGTTNNRGVQNGILKKSLDWSMGSKDVVYLTSIDYGKYLQEDRPFFTIRADNEEDIMDFISSAFKRLTTKTL